MTATKLAAALVILGAAISLVGCSTAPTEEQVEAAWDTCTDGFDARPEVVEQAWTDEYESLWRIGGLWWEFGAGDICDDIQDDTAPEVWVEHADDPAWYVDRYLSS